MLTPKVLLEPKSKHFRSSDLLRQFILRSSNRVQDRRPTSDGSICVDGRGTDGRPVLVHRCVAATDRDDTVRQVERKRGRGNPEDCSCDQGDHNEKNGIPVASTSSRVPALGEIHDRPRRPESRLAPFIASDRRLPNLYRSRMTSPFCCWPENRRSRESSRPVCRRHATDRSAPRSPTDGPASDAIGRAASVGRERCRCSSLITPSLPATRRPSWRPQRIDGLGRFTVFEYTIEWGRYRPVLLLEPIDEVRCCLELRLG